MIINGEFTLREVAGEYLLVPVGSTAITFNGMIILSETGALVWKAIAAGEGTEKAVGDILNEYDIDETTARKDVLELIQKLLDGGIISE